MFGHRLIHDYHQSRVGPVVCCEGSAIQQPDAHGPEILAIDRCKTRKLQFPILRNLAFGRVRRLSRSTGSGQRVRGADSDDPGLVGKSVDHNPMESGNRDSGGVLVERQLILADQYMVGTKTWVHGTHLLEATQKSSGCGEQHQGDGNLGHHQR